MQAASTKTYVCCVASEPPLNETAEFQCSPGVLPVSYLRSLSLLKQLDKGYVLQGPGSDRQPKYHEEGELINGRHPENWLGIGRGAKRSPAEIQQAIRNTDAEIHAAIEAILRKSGLDYVQIHSVNYRRPWWNVIAGL